jgi:myo-inositol-1(or 4)-monophosphatase
MFGAYFEYELQSWDYAAGRLFVEEAGGRVTNCRGGELPIAKTSLLATNGHLHDAVLEIVTRNLPTSQLQRSG